MANELPEQVPKFHSHQNYVQAPKCFLNDAWLSRRVRVSNPFYVAHQKSRTLGLGAIAKAQAWRPLSAPSVCWNRSSCVSSTASAGWANRACPGAESWALWWRRCPGYPAVVSRWVSLPGWWWRSDAAAASRRCSSKELCTAAIGRQLRQRLFLRGALLALKRKRTKEKGASESMFSSTSRRYFDVKYTTAR